MQKMQIHSKEAKYKTTKVEDAHLSTVLHSDGLASPLTDPMLTHFFPQDYESRSESGVIVIFLGIRFFLQVLVSPALAMTDPLCLSKSVCVFRRIMVLLLKQL